MIRSSAQLAAILTLGLSATTVHAQSGNASDVTGAPITSGAIIGGKLVPISTITAVRTATASVGSELLFGALASSRGNPIPTEAQALITNLVSGNQSAVAQFVAGFAGTGAPAASVTALANSLLGLIIAPTAQQIVTAMEAWNTVVREASASFLESPSAEFEATAALMVSFSSAFKAQGGAQ